MPVVNYLWNPLNDNIVREFDDAGTVIAGYTTEANQFGNVVSQRRNGVDSVYHYDGQGSTLALTNSNGDVTDTYAYSAFGEVTAHTGSTINPFQYVGKVGYYVDAETEDYEVRRRPLTMVFSRWLAADPLDDQLSMNSYQYARNNPAIHTDASGMALFQYACCSYSRFCGSTIIGRCFGPRAAEQTTDKNLYACPLALDKSGNPLITPITCCTQHIPSSYDIYCTKYVIKTASRGGCKALWDSVCEQDMVNWLSHAGESKGTVGWLACVVWCDKCIAAYDGVTKAICVEQICGNAYK